MTDVGLKKVCRFCLEQDKEKLGDIFNNSEQFGKTPLAVQAMSCVSTDIYEGDGMPRYCCHLCRQLIERLHRFKQICRKSEVALRQCIITEEEIPPMFDHSLFVEEGDQSYDLESYAEYEQYVMEARVKYEEEQSCADLESSVYEQDVKEEQREKSDVEEKGEIQVNNLLISCDSYPRSSKGGQELALHRDTHKERNYVCEVCGDTLISRKDLEEHLHKHLEKHPCSVCGRSYVWKKDLKRHKQQQHNDALKIHCPSCPKKYLNKQELLEHVSSVHEKPRPFPCKLCEKAFAFKKGLVRHIKNHHH